MAKSYLGFEEGSYAARKGRLCKIKKIHFEMDPPSVTVYMMDTENEVGTEFDKLNHIKSWYCHMCTAQNSDINATKCFFCNVNRDYKEKLIIYHPNDIDIHSYSTSNQQPQQQSMMDINDNGDVKNEDDGDNDIKDIHDDGDNDNDMEQHELSQSNESTHHQLTEQEPIQKQPLNKEEDVDDEEEENEDPDDEDDGDNEQQEDNDNDNDEDEEDEYHKYHGRPIQNGYADRSNVGHPMNYGSNRFNGRRVFDPRRRYKRYDPWGFGYFPEEFMNFGI